MCRVHLVANQSGAPLHVAVEAVVAARSQLCIALCGCIPPWARLYVLTTGVIRQCVHRRVESCCNILARGARSEVACVSGSLVASLACILGLISDECLIESCTKFVCCALCIAAHSCNVYCSAMSQGVCQCSLGDRLLTLTTRAL